MADFEPTPTELLRAAIESRMADVYTALPAVVVSYDDATKTCSARLAIKRPIQDEEGEITYETFPDVLNVPVMFPRSTAFALNYPLTPGDGLLLVFSGLSPAEWRATGNVPSAPGDVRRHAPAYCVALPGWFPDSVPSLATGTSIGPAPPDLARLSWDPNVAKFGVGSDFVAMAAQVLVQLSALKAAIISAAAAEVGAGGTGGMTALVAALGGTWPAAVASTNLKAD